MTEFLKVPCSVLAASAGFHHNQARDVIGEVPQELCSVKAQVQLLARFYIDPVQLKHMFRDIYA